MQEPLSQTHPRSRERSTLLLGVALVMVGALFLILRVLDVDLGRVPWPLWIIIPGALIVLASLFSRSFAISLAIPGCMVTMIGLILLARQQTQLWSSWAYAWALVAPGAVGLGLMLQGLVLHRPWLMRTGLRNVIAGLVIFLLLAALFELAFGIDGTRFSSTGRLVIPAALVVLGLALVGGSLLPRRTAT